MRKVGIWFKRLAWFIPLVELGSIILSYSSVSHLPDLSSSLAFISFVQILLLTAGDALFRFLLVYAAGVIIEHLAAGSTAKERKKMEALAAYELPQ
jgi:hypothetical protein